MRVLRQRQPQVWSTAVMPMSRAKMPRVGGDGEHGLRCRPEQQVVHDRLVVQGDVGDSPGMENTTWK